MEATEGLETIAKKMKPIDKLIFLAFAEGQNPFSKSLMARVDKEMNLKGVASNIRRSVTRLSCHERSIQTMGETVR